MDLVLNTFTRECDEYKIIFDFNDMIERIILKPDNLEFKTEFEGKIMISNNLISVIYNSDNDNNKKIIIQLL